eukprot:m.40259 g.40259  ORF g.40259 m.40259 type:complete len:185 (-) comp6913_c1_seq1:226-780(-)
MFAPRTSEFQSHPQGFAIGNEANNDTSGITKDQERSSNSNFFQVPSKRMSSKGKPDNAHAISNGSSSVMKKRRERANTVPKPTHSKSAKTSNKVLGSSKGCWKSMPSLIPSKTFTQMVQIASQKNTYIRENEYDDLRKCVHQKRFWRKLQIAFDTAPNQLQLARSSFTELTFRDTASAPTVSSS